MDSTTPSRTSASICTKPGGRLQRKALCGLPVWPPARLQVSAVAVQMVVWKPE